jgi:hypothetical protein
MQPEDVTIVPNAYYIIHVNIMCCTGEYADCPVSQVMLELVSCK